MSLTPEELAEIRDRNDTEIINATHWEPASQAAKDVEALLDHIDTAETNHKRIQAQALRDAADEWRDNPEYATAINGLVYEPMLRYRANKLDPTVTTEDGGPLGE